MNSVRISSKGQITLPAGIRRSLGVVAGDRVAFENNGGKVSVRALGPCTAQALAGSLRQYARNAEKRQDVRAQVKKEVARAAAREK